MTNKNAADRITFDALFVSLTAIRANIPSIAPFFLGGWVPITLPTFFAILSGLVLGSRLGAFTMFVYMALGLAGAPVFAQFKGGAATILTPTFGFILSFILISYVAGKIIERKATLPSYITAALIAMVLNYVIGTNWLYASYLFWFDAPGDFSYKIAWLWMMAPLPKDIALSVLAGVFAFRLQKQGIMLPSLKQQQLKEEVK